MTKTVRVVHTLDIEVPDDPAERTHHDVHAEALRLYDEIVKRDVHNEMARHGSSYTMFVTPPLNDRAKRCRTCGCLNP